MISVIAFNTFGFRNHFSISFVQGVVMWICRLNLRVIVACAVAILVSANLVANDKRPNVLLIVVDDTGYSDIGTFGGEIRTSTHLFRLETTRCPRWASVQD